MKHLNAEELLLLAEGELDGVRAAHALGCAECLAASRKAEAELSFFADALAEARPVEPVNARAESMLRLRTAMAAAIETAHLPLEDLLLHLDDEPAPGVATHLEHCADCHDELLRTQALLFDVEHELRALIPEESRQARLASATRLEKALDARRSRVLTFPAPWRAVYAVAALVAAGLFGVMWQAREPLPSTPSTVAAVAPAGPRNADPLTPDPLIIAAAAPAAPPTPVMSASPTPATDASPTPATDATPAVALAALPAAPQRFDGLAQVDLAAPGSIALAARGPALAPDSSAALAPALYLPSLERPQTPERGQPRGAAAPTTVVAVDRPAGGIVRSALVEHYTDAARRSFQTVRPELLEGELARYVSEVLKADSELLRQAYALRELVSAAEPETLDPPEQRRLRAEARRYLAGISAQEQQIYAKLSEALPRRYWANRGDRAARSPEGSLAMSAQEILDAALELDRNLSAVFVDADELVRLQAEPASVGDLLFRVRASSRNLQERLSVLR